MKPLNNLRFIFFVVLMQPMLAVAGGLTLSMAERLALDADPLSKSFQQHAQAFDEHVIASQQWPDPRIKLGVLSLPTDSYELDQEPMTQIILGYSQMLPRGNSLDHKAHLMYARAGLKRADEMLRQREVRLQVRKAWLNVYLQEQSENIIKKNRQLFREQLDVSQSLYAAGRKQQQDVLQAELELSLLDDQLQQMSTKVKEARVGLAQWVGADQAGLPLKPDGNQFGLSIKHNLEQLNQQLEQHPGLLKKGANITVSEQQVALAKQKYKPQWGFDLTYGKRDGLNMDGSDRADFFSAMVSLDLPVFTGQSQDRELSATKKQLQASHYEQQDLYLQLKAKLGQAYARSEKLATRLYLYDHKVLPQARQNARAALNGYQSGVVNFFALTGARSAELKAQLQRLKLSVEKAMSHASIRFFVGDE
ncbi:MAG: TolC family protein [Gammaproteobacteria bacterium]|nr:TolC family protein [Gammaproteobacteria bacterium]